MAHYVATLPTTTKAHAMIAGYAGIAAALAILMRALVGG